MRKSVIAIIVIVLVALYTSIFVVKEGERGIKFQFSSVVRDGDKRPVIYEPGLHFKVPFIQSVKTLDARIQKPDRDGTHRCPRPCLEESGRCRT